MRDREDFAGTSTASRDERKDDNETSAALRPEALAEVRDAFTLLETTFLADGRDWVLGSTGGPTLADIEAVWPLHWLSGLPGALDANVVSRDMFPRVYSWIARFQAAVGRAREDLEQENGQQLRTVSGEEARGLIAGSGFCEEEAGVDGGEALVRFYGLAKGVAVEVFPTDTGSAHVDVGRLVGIAVEEVVFETEAGVRVHAPRHGFRVRPGGALNPGPNL